MRFVLSMSRDYTHTRRQDMTKANKTTRERINKFELIKTNGIIKHLMLRWDMLRSATATLDYLGNGCDSNFVSLGSHF